MGVNLKKVNINLEFVTERLTGGGCLYQIQVGDYIRFRDMWEPNQILSLRR